MRVALLYPPAGDVRAPQLALPSLAAYLRAAGHEVSQRDLNLTAVIHCLQPAELTRAADKLKAKVELTPRQAHLLRLLPAITALATTAPQVLRNPTQFFDPHQFNMAREAVNLAVELHAAALPRAVKWKITPLTYEINDADPAKLRDIIATTANNDGNVFAQEWQANLLPALKQETPDLIGITITNRQQWWAGLYLARLLHEAGFFVVLGGALMSKFADRLRVLPTFFQTFCRAVITYEGESALLALLTAMAEQRDFNHVPNLLYLNATGQVNIGQTHVEDVPCLPTPDFSGLPLTDYFIPSPVLPILTGKGCYFNRCKFCDIPHINHISRKAYRIRPVERIIADITQLERQYGCQNFLITDEALAPKLLNELADGLIAQQKTHYAFTGYARFESGFHLDVCQKLAKIGMRKLYFGLESASQRTIDHMDKGVKVENIRPVLENCQQAGIHFHIFSIIGFPQEDETEARKTFQFFIDNHAIINHPGNSFDIHPFGLQLHTAYFNEHSQQGITISPELLQREFLIGLGNHEWQNQQGLSPERIQTLIDEVFYPELRTTYHRWHNTALHLWSGFEEYAVLYSNWYREQPFLAITSIRDLPLEQGFTVTWTALATFEIHETQALLILPAMTLTLPKILVQLLSVQGQWTLHTLTAAFFGEELRDDSSAQAQVIQTINTLAGCGAIHLTQVVSE